MPRRARALPLGLLELVAAECFDDLGVAGLAIAGFARLGRDRALFGRGQGLRRPGDRLVEGGGRCHPHGRRTVDVDFAILRQH